MTASNTRDGLKELLLSLESKEYIYGLGWDVLAAFRLLSPAAEDNEHQVAHVRAWLVEKFTELAGDDLDERGIRDRDVILDWVRGTV